MNANNWFKSWSDIDPMIQAKRNEYDDAVRRLDDNQDALSCAYQNYSQQVAMQNQMYQNQAYHQQFNRMHQPVNVNMQMIDMLKRASETKMIACKYCYTDEEVTWALLENYEQSETDGELYIKWEK